MRKFGFVIIIALLTLSALSERGDRAGSTDGEASGAGEPANLQQPTHHRLEVLTYNAFLRPAPVGWGDEVACRAERIGQRLLDEFSERDVIAFNETFHESSVDDLAETLEEAFPHQLLRRPKSGGGRINGGLSLLSRHPIEQWDSQSFSRCEGDFSNCLANKGFLWTLLRVSTHLKVNVVTTHLNSGGGDEAREVRRRQLGELRDYLDKLPTTDDWPTILTGDLNINGLRVDTDSDRTSSSNEYTDAMARLGNTCARCESARCFATCDAYPVDTFRDHHGPWSHDAQNTVEPNTYNCTGDTVRPCETPNDHDRWEHRSRIDYIMHFGPPPKSPDTKLTVRDASSHPFDDATCDTRYLSDHKAIEATIEITRHPNLRASSPRPHN